MTDQVTQNSEAAIAAGSQSFAAAARLFDRRTRHDAVMLYAWCRHCDDVIDGQTLGHQSEETQARTPLERLAALERQTEAALSGKTGLPQTFEALQRVVRSNAISNRYPLDLLEGFRMDVEGRVYRTIQELELYCYHVAGVVGIMMALIMGTRDEDALDRACDLGIAFQLTNIARDLVEDAHAGRSYAPTEYLAEAGMAAIDPKRLSQADQIHGVALALLARADHYYASAYAGLSFLPARSAWAIAAALRIYRAIGQKIRSNGPSKWDQRATTSRWTKLGLVGLATTDVVSSRIHKPLRPRTTLFNRRLVHPFPAA